MVISGCVVMLDTLLDRVVKVIVDEEDPEQIILFGSSVYIRLLSVNLFRESCQAVFSLWCLSLCAAVTGINT